MARIIIYAAATVYPILVFIFLVVLDLPVRYISVFIVLISLAFFITFTSGKKDRLRIISSCLLCAAGLAGFLLNSSVFLKLYPVLMNAVMLAFFTFTLIRPPSMIFRFAVLQDKKIRSSLAKKRIEKYCQKVTIVWCVFFIFNGGIAAWTVFRGSELIWSVYNGGLSYLLIGVLFASELIVRKMTNKKMPKAAALSELKRNSRPDNHIICYEKYYGGGDFKTWKDFFIDTACLRQVIKNSNHAKWILHAEDCWFFLCAFTALLQQGRQVWITANISPSYIDEIMDGTTAFFTDQTVECKYQDNIFFIPSLLEKQKFADEEEPVPINADETVIMMYTSGSTGEPKAIQQRLTEFEADNRFILSKWGEEWLSRKVCSTVSHHHIYGLLFGILLPFTAGVPFRRLKITAAEIETLTNTSYMLVTVPGFLKRTVELKMQEEPAYGFKNIWIYTSAGVLERELARKTEKIYGFWPLEVYGSTETSGIAWRISKNGPEWTPFDNAQIRLNEEGCLVISSPYIKDPQGFTTSDMAEILDDGRFILKGRAGSIVKIEEKRISLNEIEERLRQSGLVSDACVISMNDKRQYIAAAAVLSEKGKEEFHGCRKLEINRRLREYLSRFLEPVAIPRRWRYVQSLPADVQGKRKKAEIEALFGTDIIKARLITAEKASEIQTAQDGGKNAVVEFTITGGSDYFNGHFPSLQILPAIGQFELVVRYANRYLGTSLLVKWSKKLKFTSPVYPDTSLRLEMLSKGNSVDFKIDSPDGKILYSYGNFITEEHK
jgi:uncharacterized membrane protein/acyl-CoA synthetase (AMP-forming)/AMP-acid ligase II